MDVKISRILMVLAVLDYVELFSYRKYFIKYLCV